VRSAGLAAAVVAGLLAQGAAAAETPASIPGGGASASVDPGVARLGERVTYRGRVIQWNGGMKWLPPELDGDLTWGARRPGLKRAHPPARVGKAARAPARFVPDTLTIEAPLQVFRTGVVTIPGVRLRSVDPRDPAIYRLPAVNLIVVPVLGPADSNADLKPPRGPLAAPWWERVSWSLVAAGVLGVAGASAALVWWRRRRPVEAPITARRVQPGEAALAELAALRRLGLPGKGRFAEHALQLSHIARRFLEATAMTPRPGDCTPELLEHLEGAGVHPDDLDRLAPLLGLWDRLKFGRAPSSAEEASRAEQAVEAMVRRRLPEPVERAA